MVRPSASARVPLVASSITTGMSAAAAYTARSGTVPDAGAVVEVTAAAGVFRVDCDPQSHAAGGTPASSTDAITAVRLLTNESLRAGISSCLAASRIIEVLIGDTRRRRARSSDRSHRRLTVRGMPPEIFAIAVTAGRAN